MTVNLIKPDTTAPVLPSIEDALEPITENEKSLYGTIAGLHQDLNLTEANLSAAQTTIEIARRQRDEAREEIEAMKRQAEILVSERDAARRDLVTMKSEFRDTLIEMMTDHDLEAEDVNSILRSHDMEELVTEVEVEVMVKATVRLTFDGSVSSRDMEDLAVLTHLIEIDGLDIGRTAHSEGLEEVEIVDHEMHLSSVTAI